MLRPTTTRPPTGAARRRLTMCHSKPKQAEARPRAGCVTGFEPHPDPDSVGLSGTPVSGEGPGQSMRLDEASPSGPQQHRGANDLIQHRARHAASEARFPAAPQNRGNGVLVDITVSRPGGRARRPILPRLLIHTLHLEEVRAYPTPKLVNLVGAMPVLRPHGKGPKPKPDHRRPDENRQLHPGKATLHSSQIHHHHPGGVNLGRTSAGPATTASWRRPLLNGRVNHPDTPKQAAKGGAPQLARGFPTRGPRPDQNDSGLPALGRGDDHRINSIKVAEPGHQQLAPQRRGATPRREGGHQVRGGNLLATPIAHDFQ